MGTPDGSAGPGREPTPPSGRRRPHRLRRFLIGWLVFIVLALVAAFIARTFFVQTFFVPTGSMEPTLMPGDRMLVLKSGYTISRGAVVVFRRPPGDVYDTNNEDLVKRVIGLPGETIWSQGNTVFVNGRPLAQPWIRKGEPLGSRPIVRQRVPAGEYFVLGDNRPSSLDSRWWGDVPRSDIIGRVLLVFWRHDRPAFDTI